MCFPRLSEYFVFSFLDGSFTHFPIKHWCHTHASMPCSAYPVAVIIYASIRRPEWLGFMLTHPPFSSHHITLPHAHRETRQLHQLLTAPTTRHKAKMALTSSGGKSGGKSSEGTISSASTSSIIPTVASPQMFLDLPNSRGFIPSSPAFCN